MCGEVNVQFHHIRKKRFTLGNRAVVASLPMNVLISELKRCVPLCKFCHIAVHNDELDVNFDEAAKHHRKLVDDVNMERLRNEKHT